ncbi:MAG: hypothetical protein L7W43_13485, partial [Rubripirellula sp.]|nr:hypothetical protein [Rubripirellula sp.]
GMGPSFPGGGDPSARRCPHFNVGNAKPAFCCCDKPQQKVRSLHNPDWQPVYLEPENQGTTRH